MREGAKLPTKAYHSAGYDLYPAMLGVVKSGEQVKIPLGFATEFPSGYVALIDDRSSTGNAGLSHMAGTIDSDYRGEWMVILRNFADTDYVYSPEKAVAQVLFIQVENPTWEWSETLSDSFRGDKCLGSTDVVKVFDRALTAQEVQQDSVMTSPRVLQAVNDELIARAEDGMLAANPRGKQAYYDHKEAERRHEAIKNLSVGNHLNIKNNEAEPPRSQ